MIELKRITDIDTLMEWRAEVIKAVFGIKPDPALLAANRRYYRQHIDSGNHLAIEARVDGNEAGCGAVCFGDELPSPDNPGGKCAYLMNIYVRQPYRRHGLGRTIIMRLVQEAMVRDCGKIYLETTQAAASLYGKCGFSEMKGMMKYDDHPI